MLVLTRKKDQSIIIGNDIEIRVLKMGKNFVEIGISAPKNLSIFRKEIYLEIQKKNIEAVKSIEKGDIKDIKNIFDKLKK